MPPEYSTGVVPAHVARPPILIYFTTALRTMAKNAVLIKLEELGLEQYASALIDDKGYDDLGALQGLTKHQAEEIADNVQMKPGHKRKPL